MEEEEEEEEEEEAEEEEEEEEEEAEDVPSSCCGCNIICLVGINGTRACFMRCITSEVELKMVKQLMTVE